MMQEVANDSNGESAYDFVSDAKKEKDSPPPSLLASGPSSFPSSMSSSGSSTTSTPLYAPPGSVSNTLPTGQKPSYAYPPGFPGSSAGPPSRAPPLGPPVPLGPPSFHPSTISKSSDTVSDISNFLKSSAINSPRQGSTGPPGGPSGHPDLNEIFGSDLMAQLPPLQENRTTLPVSLGGGVVNPPTGVTAAPGPPRGMTAPPLPPSFPVVSGVNPYSSQAAGGHLPSFSALPPLPSLGTQPERTVLPLMNSFGPPGVAPPVPPPVAMMSVPTSGQNLPGQFFLPGQPDLGQNFSSVNTLPPQFVPLDSYGSSSSSNQYPVGAPPPRWNDGQGGVYPSDPPGSHSMNRSWWVQSSFDALKNVTEKAKNTAFNLMTTLDPQMKQFGASGTGSSAPVGGELTLFYIGNETNLLEIIKSAAEFSYKNVHIYPRSGVAVGHKQQIGFANALRVASRTIQQAQTSANLHSSLLLAIEPFVVELEPGTWYASTCLVLSDTLSSRGPDADFLHTFSQLTLLPNDLVMDRIVGQEFKPVIFSEFGQNQQNQNQNQQQLPAPLDDLLAERSSQGLGNPYPGVLRRDTWLEQLSGVSWGSTVAFSLRQLIAIHKIRYP